MKAPEGLKTSVALVQQAGGRQLWFGVAHPQGSHLWIVWLSVFGNDVEPLSGWRSDHEAETMLRLYVAAAAVGRDRLLEEIEESRTAANHVPPGSFTVGERSIIRRAMATTAQ